MPLLPPVPAADLRNLDPKVKNRGVTVTWFLWFANAIQERVEDTEITTRTVVQMVVAKDTKEHGCPYWQLPYPDTMKPSFYVSHSWDRPFSELVQSIQQRFKGVKDSQGIWLDFLAINQHREPEGIIEDLEGAQEVIKSTKKTLLVLDPAGLCFGNLWSLMEQHLAVTKAGKLPTGQLEVMPYLLEHSMAPELAAAVFNIDVERASGSFQHDKDELLEHVQEAGGAEQFNATIKRAMVAALGDIVSNGKPGGELTRWTSIIGSVFRIGGYYDLAEPMLKEALQIRRRALGEEDADTGESLCDLGMLLWATGDLPSAEPMVRRGMEVTRRCLGVTNMATAESITNLATVLRSKHDYDGAEEMYRRALEIKAMLAGEVSAEAAASRTHLANLLWVQGKISEAGELYKEVLDIRQQVLGEDHADTAAAYNNHGLAQKAVGDLEGAEASYRRALAIRQQLLGENHAMTANSINSLAAVLKAEGNLDESEALYRRAVEVRSKVFGEGHPLVATSLSNLASLLVAKDDLDGAEPLYQRALALRRQALGDTDPLVVESCNNLAAVFEAWEDYDGATALYRQAIASQTAEEDGSGLEEHVYLATSYYGLACILDAEDQLANAEVLYRKALDMRQKLLGERHSDYNAAVNGLATVLTKKGDLDGAEPLYRRALELRREALGEDHVDTAPLCDALAVLLSGKGDKAGAEEMYRRSASVRRKAHGPEHIDTAFCIHNLGCFLYEKRELVEAEELLREAIVLRRKLRGVHVETGESIHALAQVLEARGDLKEADVLYREAIEINRRTVGMKSTLTAKSLKNLAEVLRAQGSVREAEPLARKAVEIKSELLKEGVNVTSTTRLSSLKTAEDKKFLQELDPDPAKRGVTVAWFLSFADDSLKRMNHTPNCTTKEVVLGVVKGDTKEWDCAYVEMPSAENRVPKYFISHTWHRPFSELYECIKQRFHGADQNEETIWLDFLAFNQHLKLTDMLTDLETLGQTVTATQRTLLVVDPDGMCFRRAWCLKECHAAALSDGPSDTQGKLEFLPFALTSFSCAERLGQVINKISLDASSSFSPVDKGAIVMDVRAMEGGVDGFVDTVKRAAASCLETMVDLVRGEDQIRMLWTVGVTLQTCGHDGPAESLLRKAQERATADLGLNHVLTAPILDTFAAFLQGKGEQLDTAESLYSQALDSRRALLGDDDPATITSAHNLAGLVEAAGQLGRAEDLHRQVVLARLRVLGIQHPDTVASIDKLVAVVSQRLSGGEEEPEPQYSASKLYKESLAEKQDGDAPGEAPGDAPGDAPPGEVPGEEAPGEAPGDAPDGGAPGDAPDGEAPEASGMAAQLTALAIRLHERGALDDAAQLYRQALDLNRAELGDEHLETAANCYNLGLVLIHQGNPGSAEPFIQQSLDVRDEHLGTSDPLSMESAVDLAALLKSQGELEKAEPVMRRILECKSMEHGSEDPLLLPILDDLASVLNERGNMADAERMYSKSLQIRQEVLEVSDVATCNNIRSLAIVKEAQGRIDDAEKFYQQALELRRKVLGKEAPDTISSMEEVASVLLKKGTPIPRVEPMLRKAVELRAKVMGSDHESTANAAFAMAGLLHHKKKDYEGAEEFYRQALQARRKVLGEEHKDTAACRSALAELQTIQNGQQEENGGVQAGQKEENGGVQAGQKEAGQEKGDDKA